MCERLQQKTFKENIIFRGSGAPNRPQIRTQMAPKTAQEAPKTAQEAPKTAQEAPKTAQEAPRTAQEAPKTAQELQNGSPGWKPAFSQGFWGVEGRNPAF